MHRMPNGQIVRLLCLGLLFCPLFTVSYAGQLEDQLIGAAFSGKAEMVRNLIEQGADVNAKDEGGYPVLMHAVRPYGEKVVQVLLENGAKVDITDAIGSSTPLILAANLDSIEIAQMLLAAGADTEFKAGDGSTALIKACVFGHTAIVQLLVDSGADINAKDQFGFTPLKVALMNKHAGIAAYLRAKGARE